MKGARPAPSHTDCDEQSTVDISEGTVGATASPKRHSTPEAPPIK
jgi:hypothetical protein